MRCDKWFQFCTDHFFVLDDSNHCSYLTDSQQSEVNSERGLLAIKTSKCIIKLVYGLFKKIFNLMNSNIIN